MIQETRVFGGKEDKVFWSDKPLQQGHPEFKTKWYHIHWYNIPFMQLIVHKYKGLEDVMHVENLKCRCGKVKSNHSLNNIL